MSEIKTIAGYINHCTDTAENWTLTNPVIPAGVLCLEVNTNNTIRLKLGDGVTPWNLLPYRFDHSIGQATETELGLVLKATPAEALSGLDLTKYLTPTTLKYVLDNVNIASTGIVLQPGTIPYKFIPVPVNITQTYYNTGVSYGEQEPLNFIRNNEIIFRMEHRGSATLSLIHRMLNTGATGYTRVLKNNSQLIEWSTTSLLNTTKTLNISFVPGDIIQVQGRTTTSAIAEEISSCQILIQNLT